MEFAEEEFQLWFPVGQGDAPLEKHYEQAAYSKKVSVDEIIPFKKRIPSALIYLWNVFLELHSTRTSNGFGINRISYLEMKAWESLTGISLDPWELEVIVSLDNLFLAMHHDRFSRA